MPIQTAPAFEALAHALQDAGIAFAAGVPGFGATQVFDALNSLRQGELSYSFHEEVAYTLAHAAGLVGRRAAVLLKAHGLAKAANSLIDSLAAGALGGVVCLVFDDPGGAHSDSIFDSRSLLQGLGLPFRMPEPERLYTEVQDAFDWSEVLGLPVGLLFDSDVLARSRAAWTPRLLARQAGGFRRDVARQVVCPPLASYQHEVLSAKLAGQDWQALPLPGLPAIPEGLPPAYQPAVCRYQPFFDLFYTRRGQVVTGDTGTSALFAFPPYNCIDLVTYMGGSLPLAAGAYLAGCREVWAISGDFAFIAAGHLGLAEAAQRGLPLKVVIFNDGHASATGGQPLPAGALERCLAGYAAQTAWVERPEAAGPALQAARAADDLRIIVVNCPVAG